MSSRIDRPRHLARRRRAKATRRAPNTVLAVTDEFQTAKANYAATRPSRFRRQRNGLGGSADAHYAVEGDFWTLREYARDMDRNDGIVGQLVDRSCDNILGTGEPPNPDTGDPELDAELVERWKEWSSDPLLCDATARHDWHTLERLALRQARIDGDHFAQPMDDLAVQFYEADRIWSPTNLANEWIHGVKLDEVGRPVSYAVLRESTHMRKRIGRREFLARADEVPARDPDGTPRILHIYDPQRMSQTRGVTVFRAVFDMLGMLEDTNFAKLVQQQLVSCIAAFIVSEQQIKLGFQDSVQDEDDFFSTEEGLTPGLTARLRPGEKIQTIQSNIPNPEYFAQVRLLLRIIGAQLGMPLTLVLLDTSDTTFHGYRGELQQARKGFERVHRWFTGRFRFPVWRWLVRHWAPDLGMAAQRLIERGRLYRVKWPLPSWPYVDPLKDAQADKIRLENGTPPRTIAAERGTDWETDVRHRVEDYALLVRKSVEAAQSLKDDLGVEVHWREIANLPVPAGMKPEDTREPAAEDSTPERQAGQGGDEVGQATATALRLVEGKLDMVTTAVASTRDDLAVLAARRPEPAPQPHPMSVHVHNHPGEPPRVDVSPQIHVAAAEPPPAPMIEVHNHVDVSPTPVEITNEVSAEAPPVYVTAEPGEMNVIAEVKLPAPRKRTAKIKKRGGETEITVQ